MEKTNSALEIFELHEGDSPVLLSIPHAGLEIPESIARRMTPAALSRVDTDWHLPRIYDFARASRISVVAATHSRYVIDLNRPPDNHNLYPGSDTTGLVPVDTFEREALYLDGKAPDDEEIAERRERYWRPYHAMLRSQLDRLRSRHSRVVLWDAHSICSVVPRFFDGPLAPLNWGTADGQSCDAGLARRTMGAVENEAGLRGMTVENVLNGRFKGGYITRHFGDPQHGVHAIQLEMTWNLYMDERAPWSLDEPRTERLRPLLKAGLDEARRWAEEGSRDARN